MIFRRERPQHKKVGVNSLSSNKIFERLEISMTLVFNCIRKSFNRNFDFVWNQQLQFSIDTRQRSEHWARVTSTIFREIFDSFGFVLKRFQKFTLEENCRRFLFHGNFSNFTTPSTNNARRVLTYDFKIFSLSYIRQSKIIGIQ